MIEINARFRFLATSLIILGSVVSAGAATKYSLAIRVQSELARVGCYRQQVDGAWGFGSRRAAADYLQRTNQSARSFEPSAGLLSDISSRSGRICGFSLISKVASDFARPVAKPVAYRPGSLADDYLSRLPANAIDPATMVPIIGLN